MVDNRNRYREKFEHVLATLSNTLAPVKPEASFYLWASTPIADTDFVGRLYADQNVTVLPGSFLSRDTNEGNPGAGKMRMALVAPLDECRNAANRINTLLSHL